MENDTNLEAFNSIVNALKGLDSDMQKRTLQAAITFLGIELRDLNYLSNKPIGNSTTVEPLFSESKKFFSENRSISPKDFMREKSPRTDVERITCLAYYLTHYRDLPHFKTIDLSTLNTEAAQPKLSNPTVATNNAFLTGLLVQAGKGNKQISSAGELFVQALPDRDAAKEVLSNIHIRKRTKKASKKGSSINNNDANGN